MKKIVTLFLTLAMLLSLTACSTETTDKDPDTTKKTTSATTKTTTEATTESTTAFDEIVVVDNDDCTIKITGIKQDSVWGYSLKTYLENKSAEKTYLFAVDSASVNGVRADAFFGEEVAPGKKANSNVQFSEDTLKENGITEYTDLVLTFRVYDSNDWTADDIYMGSVHVYPYGEDKAVKYVREAQPTDKILFDNDKVTAIVTGCEKDEFWGYSVRLFLLNKADTTVMFCADEVSVNGFMSDPYFSASVPAGECAFCSMSWSDSMLEENEITEVENIEFTFRAYGYGDWMSGEEDFANETVILNP